MQVLLKSILTGFGMKLGAEIARMMSDKMQSHIDARKADETSESDDQDQADEELTEAIPPHLPVVPLPSGDTGCENE